MQRDPKALMQELIRKYDLMDTRELTVQAEELTDLRQLHNLHTDSLSAAEGARSAADRAVQMARKLVAETQVRIELLEEKIGIPPKMYREDDQADEHEDGVPA